jgi:hypothetical protein
MEPTESVPAHKLKQADFQRHLVWRFEADSEHIAEADESHVSPAEEALRLGIFGSYLVAATFGLKNGQELPGVVQADFLGKKVLFTPTVIYAEGKPLDPLGSDTHSRLARIVKTSNAQPIGWRLDAHFAGELAARRGRISQSTVVRALSLLIQLISLRLTRKHR